ncbi:Hsp70 family protein (plasmid) [Pedobacter sp. BS3]|uniref:Hsp70 family protein n=1 Tax=Pedobacter sp. BS3 TaxID=2567937 RepID=UPI0011EC17AF|nr:Hsp70 family protein [Pedobacter sp. BS3]TZF86157.1 Hsp70 family protein [Pedobacter sp. BS3]
MKKAIGIDLGTTNSVIAFKETVLKIIRNSDGEELTRSYIALNNGEPFVGQRAYMIIKRALSSTFQ